MCTVLKGLWGALLPYAPLPELWLVNSCPLLTLLNAIFLHTTLALQDIPFLVRKSLIYDKVNYENTQ